MDSRSAEWTLLVYKIPAQPSRLRLLIWRRLQKMGALYLQDAVCLLPARPDLVENMEYIAKTIEEMEGTYHLFSATCLFPDGEERLVQQFRQLADVRYEEIHGRLRTMTEALESVEEPAKMEAAEEELKRERIAYLRAKRLAYFGSDQEAEVEAQLDTLRKALDDIYRGREE